MAKLLARLGSTSMEGALADVGRRLERFRAITDEIRELTRQLMPKTPYDSLNFPTRLERAQVDQLQVRFAEIVDELRYLVEP